MDILKTIPAIPEKVDITHKINTMTVNFTSRTVMFDVIIIGKSDEPGIPFQVSVGFTDVIALVTAPQKNTFVLVVRTALSIAMGVDISKIPLDIFAP